MKAVIPAAGLGTRFYPITRCIPKEMLPINNKPIIQYVIEEAIDAGAEDIAIITRKDKTVIEDYIDIMDFNAQFYYIRQKEQLGLGHAIYQSKRFIANEDFMVLLGDDILSTHQDLLNMVGLQGIWGGAFVAVEEVDNPSKYGIANVIDINQKNIYLVDRIIEKPTKRISSNLGACGRYVLTPHIFDCIKRVKPGKNNEIQLTDALNYLKHPLYAYKIIKKRYDCGNVESYKDTILNFCPP